MVGRDDEYTEPTAAERRVAERRGTIIVGVLLLAIAVAVLAPFIGGEGDTGELYFYAGLLLLCGVIAGGATLWKRLR